MEFTIVKHNAAANGFNLWTLNGEAFSMATIQPVYPLHLHRHSFELTRIGGRPTSGVIKDVVLLGGFQEVEFDFVADNPDALPLSPAAAHGFRLHGALQLCLARDRSMLPSYFRLNA